MANQQSSYSLSNMISCINNNFGIIFIAIILLIGGFFVGSLWTENQLLSSDQSPAKVATQPTADTPTPVDPPGPTQNQLAKMPKITDADHIRGSKNPKIYLVEYSDFECSFCQKFHPTMKQVIKEYGDQVAWVYRHFPLNFHPEALPSAKASECIAKKVGEDAFWKFVDAIFEENNKLGGKITPEATDTAITASGANLSVIKDCVANNETQDLVTQSQAGGTAAGVSGTPGTILLTTDGKSELISGALTFEQVKQVIEEYL